MFWIFTFFGNSDSAVHPHLHVNFFIVSSTSLYSPISPSIHISSPIPLPSPYFYSNISPHSSLSHPTLPHPIPPQYLSTTYPQFINKLSTAFPQVIHNPYLINRHLTHPYIPTSIVNSPIIPIIFPT